MAHDQHDEQYIREHWWEYASADELHADTHAPKYTPARTMATRAVVINGQTIQLPLGSFDRRGETVTQSGRKSYR